MGLLEKPKFSIINTELTGFLMIKNLISLVKQRLFKKPALKQGVFILVLILIVGALPFVAHAGIDEILSSVFLTIVEMLLGVIGSLITLVMAALINVAQFNDFISAPAVVVGWVLVRDICNMFFIVGMLLISVGTVLGIQSFHYKNYLKKIILFAILVNFSRTISGILIDVSQIVMLTFISASKAAMAVGFVEAFGINKLTSLATHVDASGKSDVDGTGILFSGIFAIIAAGILLMVLLSVVVMLAYRIVMLWVLVIFSPVYFALQAIPKADGKAGFWWKSFSEQLIAGPVVAFFIWLTLSVVSMNDGSFANQINDDSNVNPSVIGSQVSNAPYILNYIMGIAMLLIGMSAASKLGGAAGAAANKVFGKAKGLGMKGLNKGARGLGMASEGAARLGLKGVEKAKGSEFKKGSRTAVMQSLLTDRQKNRQKTSAGKWEERLKKAGVGDATYTAMQERLTGQKDRKKLKQAVSGTALGSGVAGGVAGALVAGASGVGLLGAAGYVTSQALFRKNGGLVKAIKDKETDYKKVRDTKENIGTGIFSDNKGLFKDKEGKIKEGAVSELLGKPLKDQTSDEHKASLESEISILQDAIENAKPVAANPAAGIVGRKGDKKKLINAQKQLNETIEAFQYGHEHGILSTEAEQILTDFKAAPGAADYQKPEDLGTSAYVANSALDTELPGAGIQKSKKKKYLTDLAEKAVNTGMEFDQEVAFLQEGDLVKGKDGSEGWHVNQDKTNVAQNRITISNGAEEQEVDMKEFLSQNQTIVADHLYNSDRYKKMINKDHIFTREEFDNQQRISQSSQKGITYRAGNKAAAINVKELEKKTGDVTGEQDRAGLYVAGDEAVKVADGMKSMLEEQKKKLNEAKTEDEVRDVLGSYFGRVTDVAGDELEKFKETTINNVDASIQSLDTSDSENVDRIKTKGFSLVDKTRSGYEAKHVLRHEDTHAKLEEVDEDGSLRQNVWNQLDPTKQKEAREYIAATRGEGLSQEEIQTEYIVDALQNTHKPGGPDKDKPQLPASLVNLLSGDKVVSGNIRVEHEHNVGEMAEKYTEWQDQGTKTTKTLTPNKPNIAQELLNSGWNGSAIMDTRQFVQFKKWLGSIDDQVSKLGKKQNILDEEMTQKFSKLRGAVKGMDMEGDNIDLSVRLQESGLDEKDIKEVVEQYSEEEEL